MRVIIRALHDSKKHLSNASCAGHESVFLYAAWKLTAMHLLSEKDQGIQQKSTPAKRDKMREHKETNGLSSIYVLLFQSTADDIFIKPTECQTR